MHMLSSIDNYTVLDYYLQYFEKHLILSKSYNWTIKDRVLFGILIYTFLKFKLDKHYCVLIYRNTNALMVQYETWMYAQGRLVSTKPTNISGFVSIPWC